MKKLLLFFVIVSTSFYCNSQVLEQDSLALVTLYNNTGGDNWDRNYHWLNEDFPVQEWYGVEIQNSRVVKINLGFNNLVGFIPEELGNLDSLSLLDLSANTISGLPHSIGNLTTLDSILLPNAIIDSLPNEIGNLSDLKYLNISNTQIRYLPDDISGLISLQYLNSYHADLRKIPETIGNLSSLKYLDMAVNEIPYLPTGIGNCSNLLTLKLNKNHIPGLPHEITNLSQLEELVLGANNIAVLPEEIFTLHNLRTLNFAANGIKSIPASIGNLTMLENFQFFENEITAIPDEIGNLVNLNYINGYSNKLNVLPLSLLSLPNVNTLFLAYNSLTFEDIEPLVSVNGFEYWSQDSIGERIDTVVPSNSTFHLECITGGVHNTYQWLKDGDTVQGATNYYLDFPTLNFADSGVYNCEVTNTVATGLTLYSKPIYLHIKGTAGTEESLAGNDQFLLYPNPAIAKVLIKTAEPEILSGTEIIILNSEGNIMTRHITGNSNTLEIDISKLCPGTYFVQFLDSRTRTELCVKKLIVKH